MRQRIVRIVAFEACSLRWPCSGSMRRCAVDDIPRLVAAARTGDSPAPLAVLAAFVAGGLVVAPVNVLIGATMVVFGPDRHLLRARC
jgi:hypothetical protein